MLREHQPPRFVQTQPFLVLQRAHGRYLPEVMVEGRGAHIDKVESFASLGPDEQRKIERIWRHADHFAAADKYVFVTPMWNLGFPPELKIYIDSVCVAGKTFMHTPTGPAGLLKDKGKKCLHIHSSGWFHYGKIEDHSVPYLKSIMHFMGVDDFEAIVVEGVDAIPGRVQEFKKLAIEKAINAAEQF
jgi:FMN-dependent NADH-azoreductase